MKTVFVCVLCVLLVAASANSEQNAAPVTNLVEMLPYIDQFSKSLDLEVKLPITTNRVTRFRGVRHNEFRPTMGLVVESRFGFDFDAKGRFVYAFIDKTNSLGALTQSLKPPEILKVMTSPPAMTESQALEKARGYLARLGYNERSPAVSPPRIKQEAPFHWFTVEWTWTRDPGEYVLKQQARPLFKMEIDGLSGKVTDFMTLVGWRASDILSNYPTPEATLTNFPARDQP